MKNCLKIIGGLILGILLTSCSKKGCTDSDASNYNYLAKKDDGSCLYNTNESNKPYILMCNDYNTSGDTLVLKDFPDKEVDYLIECAAQASFIVKIEPGVVIEFTQNGSLTFGQGLYAKGTAANPIIFRGVDNADWGGVSLEGGSYEQIMEHAVIEKGSFMYGDPAALTVVGTGKITLRDIAVNNAPNYGVVFYNYSPSYPLTFENITISNCGKTIKMHAPQLSSITGLVLNANSNNYIDLKLGSTYSQSFTVPNLGFEYRLVDQNATLSSPKYLGTSSYLYTMSVNSGVTMIFGDNCGIYTNGAINAQGTASSPIRFTGESNTMGGWKGIRSYASSGYSPMFSYVEVDNGKTKYSPYSAIQISANSGASASVLNSAITNVSGCGIGLSNSAISLNISGTTFTNVTTNTCP